MKIAMMGLGSMGQRHLKNMTVILQEKGVEFTIDACRSSKKELPDGINELLHNEYTSIDEIADDYDIIFITNPTSLHYTTLKNVISKTKHVFMEKPVFDRTDINLSKLSLCPDSVYYVACPLRYTRVIEYLKNYVSGKKVFSGRAICSTYLPDWRPEVDYRTVYSARKELGGGVSIDLIHEWDYLCYLFGLPERVYNVKGTYSDLEITSDDLSLYIGEYQDKLVSLHLDYFGRYDKREIELYLTDEVVVGDLINNEIRFLRSGEIVKIEEERDNYQRKELSYFFDMIEGKVKNTNDLELALQVLRITKGE